MKNYILLVCTYLFISAAHAQTIRNLALEGGGIRGIAFVGAIDSLTRSGKLDSLESLAGTSSGGIIACLMAIGYTNTDIQAVLEKMKFQRFNDNGFFFISGSRRLVKQFGWYKGDRLEAFFEKLIYEKTGIRHLTFGDLYKLQSAHPDRYHKLYLTSTDLSAQRPVILSHLNYPQLPLSKALRITTCIPFYFKPVFMDSAGTCYKKPKSNAHVFVDGGMLLNYPISAFHDRDSAGNLYLIKDSYGIKLEDPLQIDYNINKQGLAPVNIRKLTDFSTAFYIMGIENLNRTQLLPEDEAHTIYVSTCNIAPRVRKLPKAEVAALVNSGRQGAGAFISQQ